MNEKRQQSKSHSDPLVSVIIPTCNRKEYLQDAINSILAQRFQDFEIIVINDGEEDVSKLVEALNASGKIRLLTHKNRKDVGAARNTGLKSAKGFYIAYLDDDDVYYPDHLETLVNALEHTDIPIAYTDSNRVVMRWITDKYVPTEKHVLYSQDFDREKMLVSNYIPTLCIAHRKDLLEEIGYFDENLEVHEDWDLWIRASIQHDFLHIKKVTAEFRVRIGQKHSKSLKKNKFLNTIKQIHDRYAHLVTSAKIIKAKNQAQNALALDVKDYEKFLIIEDYQRRHFYYFSRNFAGNRKVLDIHCEDGSGSYLLSSTAQFVVGSGQDSLQINQAGSRYIAENLKFTLNFMNSPEAEGETPFQLITYHDALKIFHNDAIDFIDKMKGLLSQDGIFILSVSSRQESDLNPTPIDGIYFNDLRSLLEKNFKHVSFWGQNIYPVSNLFAYSSQSAEVKEYIINRNINGISESGPEIKQSERFIAVASDEPLTFDPGNSFLVDTAASYFHYWETYIYQLKSANNGKQAHLAVLENEIEDRKHHLKNLETLLEGQQQHASNLEKELADQQQHAKNLEKELESSREAIQLSLVDLSAKQTDINSMQCRLNELNDAFAVKNNEIDELAAIVESRNHRINTLETLSAEKNLALNNLEAELVVIRHSLAWRMVEGFRHHVNRIFPEPSRRRTTYLKCVSAVKIYLDKGFFAVLRKAKSQYRMGMRRQSVSYAPAEQQTDEMQSILPRRLKTADEFCPIRSKLIVEQHFVNDADRQAVREKIQFIKQEQLDEFHKM